MLNSTVPAVLQIAERVRTGPWPLRPFWRALHWTITELPARLEALLPPLMIVPCLGPDGFAQCAWTSNATTNGSSRAVGTPTMMTDSGEGVCGLLVRSTAM